MNAITPSVRLSDRALLVALNISVWTARKYDKKSTAELAIKHGTADGMARVNKSLLAKDCTLDLVGKKAGSVRTFYYENTLPWAVDGSRILPSANYMAFAQEMRQRIAEWEQLRDRFIGEYPSLREDAKRLLNGLYDDADYPSPDQVAKKFGADVSFYPIPAKTDFRRTMLNEEAAELERQIEDNYKRVTAKAMGDLWQRLYDVVERAVERLSKPENVFRDSLVENAKELCGLLPRLNIADDPRLERMRQEVESTLCRHHPDTLRTAPDIREDVASKLADIMGAMYDFAA